jgi:uncharacterized protein YjbI with pentapeptide repeats
VKLILTILSVAVFCAAIYILSKVYSEDQNRLKLVDVQITDKNLKQCILGEDFIFVDQLLSLHCTNKKIANSHGIEKLVFLKELWLNTNNLTSIDVSHNTQLMKLSLAENDLANIDLSKNHNLNWVVLSHNNFTSVDFSRNSALWYIDLRTNKLDNLDISNNPALTNLNLWGNHLTSIDLSKNANLRNVYLRDNNLSSIDFSKNNDLRFARMDKNVSCKGDACVHKVFDGDVQTN